LAALIHLLETVLYRWLFCRNIVFEKKRTVLKLFTLKIYSL